MSLCLAHCPREVSPFRCPCPFIREGFAWKCLFEAHHYSFSSPERGLEFQGQPWVLSVSLLPACWLMQLRLSTCQLTLLLPGACSRQTLCWDAVDRAWRESAAGGSWVGWSCVRSPRTRGSLDPFFACLPPHVLSVCAYPREGVEEALQLHTPVSFPESPMMLLDSWRQQGSRHGCLEERGGRLSVGGTLKEHI